MSREQRLLLVINAGSSSIKYQLFGMGDRRVIARGLLERLGGPAARLSHYRRDAGGAWQKEVTEQPVADHAEGLALVTGVLERCSPLGDGAGLFGVGHRVVHGGERFQAPALVTPEVLAGIREMTPLAPLHNPANLLGIEVTLKHLPDTPQVAVFDTAFHHGLPPHAYRYALPEPLYREHGVRRYGFHGTSHAWVARQAARHLDRPPEALRLITLHLGNGASAAAIAGGRSIDTSMGMTPLEGLVMGTRCGDLDPAIPFYLARECAMTPAAIESLLNRESGLLGLAGSSDMREILARAGQGDEQATLALDLFCYRIRKYIGAYIAVLGGLDAVVFTGGIGEHAAEVRRRVCAGLEVFGIRLDPGRNADPSRHAGRIQAAGAPVALLVIPTDEELEIAIQSEAVIVATPPAGGRPGSAGSPGE